VRGEVDQRGAIFIADQRVTHCSHPSQARGCGGSMRRWRDFQRKRCLQGRDTSEGQRHHILDTKLPARL
jgi:hypothetical protein